MRLADDASDAPDRRGSLLAVAMTVLFAACGGGDDGGGGSAYVEPKGPATETISVEARQLLLQARQDHRRRRASPTIKLTAKNGIHDFVFDGAYPGFQLEADGGGGTAVEEDRPEAGEVHLLLHASPGTAPRAWKAR